MTDVTPDATPDEGEPEEGVVLEAKDGDRRFITFLLVVLVVLTVVLNIQVFRSGGDVDDVRDSAGATKTAVVEVKDQTTKIKEIAERFDEGDPEQAAALQDVFRKIDAIYQEVVLDGASATEGE